MKSVTTIAVCLMLALYQALAWPTHFAMDEHAGHAFVSDGHSVLHVHMDCEDGGHAAASYPDSDTPVMAAVSSCCVPHRHDIHTHMGEDATSAPLREKTVPPSALPDKVGLDFSPETVSLRIVAVSDEAVPRRPYNDLLPLRGPPLA